jgi:hypothetical protein
MESQATFNQRHMQLTNFTPANSFCRLIGIFDPFKRFGIMKCAFFIVLAMKMSMINGA